jgi:hypothetical protein
MRAENPKIMGKGFRFLTLTKGAKGGKSSIVDLFEAYGAWRI